MPKDGNKTRIRILEESTDLVLENGFSGTTIDHIIERTGISKGAFFYHFKNKADLALGIINHFRDSDMQMMEDARAHAMAVGNTPRDRLLTFVQWFIDYFDTLTEPHAGCLYASFFYEPEQVDDEVKKVVVSAIIRWREALSNYLKPICAESSRDDIDVKSLADMFSVVLEGAFITSKALADPRLTADQLRHYKRYLELLF